MAISRLSRILLPVTFAVGIGAITAAVAFLSSDYRLLSSQLSALGARQEELSGKIAVAYPLVRERLEAQGLPGPQSASDYCAFPSAGSTSLCSLVQESSQLASKLEVIENAVERARPAYDSGLKIAWGGLAFVVAGGALMIYDDERRRRGLSVKGGYSLLPKSGFTSALL